MVIVGHRGAKGLAKENTLSGLKQALVFEVNEIEVDVRVSSDNIPLLFHDGSLVKDGRSYKIAETDYAKLKSLDRDLTTLEECIKEVKSRAILFLEVKPRVETGPIVDLLRSNNSKLLLLGSKSQSTLMSLKQSLSGKPNIEYVVVEPWSGVRAHYRARAVGAKRISMNQRWLWSGFISSVASSGFKLYAYTINSKTKADRWAKHGLYGVVTDRPDIFAKVRSNSNK